MSRIDDSKIDGHAIELMCADLMRQRGYTIIAQNYQSGPHELDLVVMDGHTLCFVEVKARKSLGALRDLESLISPKKEANLVLAAQAFLRDRKYRPGLRFRDFRFDYLLIYIPPSGGEPGYKYLRNTIYDLPEGSPFAR